MNIEIEKKRLKQKQRTTLTCNPVKEIRRPVVLLLESCMSIIAGLTFNVLISRSPSLSPTLSIFRSTANLFQTWRGMNQQHHFSAIHSFIRLYLKTLQNHSEHSKLPVYMRTPSTENSQFSSPSLLITFSQIRGRQQFGIWLGKVSKLWV